MAFGRVIGVVSGKGGVGKTTTTINLGAALANKLSKKVIAVDCNIGTSHLSVCLGLHQWPYTLNDVLDGKARLTEATAKDESSGMAILPASLKAEVMGTELLSRLRHLAEKLSESYDYVLLDGSPGLGPEAMATLEAANELLYVSSPTTPSVMDVVRLKHVVQGKHKKELGVALNLCHQGAKQLSPSDVARMVEVEVVAAVPFDVSVERSLSEQSSVVMAYPKSPATAEFIALAHRVTGVYKPQPDAGSSGGDGGIIGDLKRIAGF